MDLLQVITKVLLITGAVFLITLLVSYLVSKFRKPKEIVLESYPAEQYQYYHNSADSYPQNYIQEYYYNSQAAGKDEVVGSEYYNSLRHEQSPLVFQQPVYNYQISNDWIDHEENPETENPLRKTSSFSVEPEINRDEEVHKRMTIVNEIPVIKYGWE